MIRRELLFVLLFVLVLLTQGQVTCKINQILGCYSDFNNQIRAFPLGPFSPDDNSMENCAATCYRFGTTLNAVEFASQCFCGNDFNPDAHSEKEPDSDCNMACPGNATQMCGGGNRMNVYKATCTGTPLPNYHACGNDIARALPYCNTALSFEARLADLLGRLSLDEKISMLSPEADLNQCGDHTLGKKEIGLPSYFWLVETNTGVASSCLKPGQCATTFSGPLGMAASFNRTNWNLKGKVLGMEIRAFCNAGWHRGTDSRDLIAITGFGPNINIARDPRFGRTSELPGEDPYLNGHYAKHMVQGMQTQDSKGHPLMLAYLKHFTAYSRETNRGHDTYDISMHDLFETYLAQYEIGFVEGGATGAMCSYNAENGVPSCANNFLLNQVIRKLWNQTDAHITTDCGAVSNMRGPPANAPSDEYAAAWTINNGTDVEMGTIVWGTSLHKAVDMGLTTEATINAAFRRSYLPHFRAGRFDPLSSVEWTQISTDVINSSVHQAIQFEAALQSFVLLKNLNSVLPLVKGSNVAVLGPMGQTRSGMLSDYAGDEICYGGTYDCIPTIAEAIARVNVGGHTTSAAGVDINSSNSSGIPAAIQLANQANFIVLVLGIDRSIEHEGIDRDDTALPGLQEKFALQVLALGKPTVMVLSNGGALAVDNLIMGPAAIVEAYNPSVVGPSALAATLFGDFNRWGKLVTTMYPHSFIQENPMTNYDMAKPPGRTYRYYTGKPLFPFGYGLSYTTFDLSCTAKSRTDYTCTVTNTGKRDGDEVVMVYHVAGPDVRKAANHPVPIKALVEFERVSVPAGRSVPVEFTLDDKSLALVNENGVRVLYPGLHSFVFSRGYGNDVVLNVTVTSRF